MKLQHAQYKAYFGKDDYVPIFYNWELGTFSSTWIDGKWYDLLDHSLPHCGFTTDHLKQMVEELTGKKVRRLVTW